MNITARDKATLIVKGTRGIVDIKPSPDCIFKEIKTTGNTNTSTPAAATKSIHIILRSIRILLPRTRSPELLSAVSGYVPGSVTITSAKIEDVTKYIETTPSSAATINTSIDITPFVSNPADIKEVYVTQPIRKGTS